jgi:Putative DNA-binding domain
MSLSGKPLSLVTIDDLQALIDNQVAEGKEYDYKVQLIGNSDSDKKEFLADVSSFANTNGGYLIFGMDEKEGLPTALTGFNDVDSDAQINRLENLIRDSIAPRIAGIEIRSISLSVGVVLIIRIPKSWSAPHMITYGSKGNSRFNARNSRGKYQLDVHELRAAYISSETAIENIRSFRIERISKILSEETPVRMSKAAMVVLHLVPLFSPSQASLGNIGLLQQGTQPYLYDLQQLGTGYLQRPNLDGLLLHNSRTASEMDENYVQLFRNGIVEYVDAYVVNGNSNDEKLIPSVLFEESLIRKLSLFLAIQQRFGAVPPTTIMISMLHVYGYKMAHNRDPIYSNQSAAIDRNHLILPEILVDNIEDDAARILRPLFDMIWNACGFSKSPNYDENGERIKRR